MEARISFITLGVGDFQRSLNFYRDGLGLPLSQASKDDVAFFKTGGVVLALYPTDKLAEDAKVPADGSGFRGVTLAYNVRRREEVAEVLALAESVGGTVAKPAQDTFWGGHGGYFADPDGHLWEVVWNPHFPFADDGRVGEPVTVEMQVQRTKCCSGSQQVFLDSETNYRDPNNLGLVITEAGQAKFREAGIDDPTTHFMGKTIRVRGVLIRKEKGRCIEVAEAGQIEVVEQASK